MADIFTSGPRITELNGVLHDGYQPLRYAAGESGVKRIEPCEVNGTAGYMTWFRVVFDDGSDVIVSPNDIHTVHREPDREASDA